MSPEVSHYPLSTAARAQAVGVLALLTGVAVLGVLGLSLAGLEVLRWVFIGLAVMLAVALVVAVVRLARPPVVLELAETGYRVRTLRGVGVRQAAWADVRDVRTRTNSGQQVVVVNLGDGERTTTLPVRLVGESPQVWLRDLDVRLDASHGHRRL